MFRRKPWTVSKPRSLCHTARQSLCLSSRSPAQGLTGPLATRHSCWCLSCSNLHLKKQLISTDEFKILSTCTIPNRCPIVAIQEDNKRVEHHGHHGCFLATRPDLASRLFAGVGVQNFSGARCSKSSLHDHCMTTEPHRVMRRFLVTAQSHIWGGVLALHFPGAWASNSAKLCAESRDAQYTELRCVIQFPNLSTIPTFFKHFLKIF